MIPPPRSSGVPEHRRELSDATLSVWAKSQANRREWLSLVQHLLDSHRVARALFDTWLAPSVQRSWADCLPGGATDARTMVAFLAGVHDVGKATPTFAVQVEGLCQIMRDHGLECLAGYPERKYLPHALAGQLALEDWSTERALPGDLAAQLASVVGSHHGQTPTRQAILDAQDRPELAGDCAWRLSRNELLDWMSVRSGAADRWDAWRDVRLPLPVLVEMSGLVIMADWIASSDVYFPLAELGTSFDLLDEESQQQRFDRAWDELVMSPSWSPHRPTEDTTALYAARFGWSDDRLPRPVQVAAERIARRVEPGMMIVEAPTGEGKTELALTVAEIMAARTGSSGLFFALPSQATSNAVLTRLAHWVDALPGPDVAGAPWSLALAHGRSRLNAEFASMYPNADGGLIPAAERVSVFDEDENAPEVNFVAHEWFRGRKRTLLATFGVGTIDQLLFAGLQAKHLMLRHLGLAGKVVVIDEAHASDSYMNVFLDRVLGWLGAYGVPVIVLSATLPGGRRAELLAAYAPAPTRSGRRRQLDTRFTEVTGHLGYPVITTLASGSDRAEIHAVARGSDRPSAVVAITSMRGDDHAVRGQLGALLGGGGCALVLRNTVKAAQRTASFLAETSLAPVTLCHSQFMAVDRLQLDRSLLEQFGPEGTRPAIHIVVATQVVEQSLDIDFDVLLTDLPPADLLCQRLGRVHRHRRHRRPALLSEPQCFLLLDDPAADPPRADPGSTFIYGDSALFRCSAVVADLNGVLRMPSNVADFVQRAYADDLPGPVVWHKAMAMADQMASRTLASKQDHARSFRLGPVPTSAEAASLTGWLERSLGDADPDARIGRATVRDSEESLEVLVAPLDAVTGEVIVPPWLPDGSLPVSVRSMLSDDDARMVASWVIKLPGSVTRHRMAETIAALSGDPAVRRWSWHRHPWLRGELILPMRQTAEDAHELTTSLLGVELRYTPHRGLEVG